MRAVRRERNHAETDHDAERVGIAWEEAQVGIEARVAPGRQRVGAVRWDVLNRRAARWYLGVTLTLTAVGGLLTWLVVPPTGLVRSVYADVSFAGEPLSQARTPDISLAFLDEDPTLPRRFFSVEWRGFWFLPRAQAVDLYVGADDRVDILVDGQLAHRRNLSLGMGTTRETVTLGAGPHTVAIRYAQDGGGMHLNVQRAFRGGPPAPFAPTRLFPNVPDTQDVLLTTGTPWLLRVVALLWLIPFMRLMRLGWRIVGRPAVRAWQRAVGALPDSPLPALPWPQRLAIVLFPALLGPLQLVVFGPHHLYASNLAEFSAPFWSLAPYGLPVVGLTSGLLVLLGLLVPRRRFPAYVTALFTVGLLLWIQGNLIVGDYGLLDGQPLDFARHDWRTPYELALWIGVPALAITAARTVVPIAVTGSRLLVLLQTVVLGASAVQVSDAVPQWQGPPAAVFELSAHRNVLHIVLDTFQSDTFLEIAQADRDEVDRRFAGFEFFVDHAGAFPTTYLSIPAMLTGAAYRNTEPIPAFIENQFDQESLFSLLGEAGYDIDYLSGLSMGRHATNAYRIAITDLGRRGAVERYHRQSPAPGQRPGVLRGVHPTDDRGARPARLQIPTRDDSAPTDRPERALCGGRPSCVHPGELHRTSAVRRPDRHAVLGPPPRPRGV